MRPEKRRRMDAYRILELPPDAPGEQIRAHYRALTLLYHPDRHQRSPELTRRLAEFKMRQLNSAYEHLMAAERPRLELAVASPNAEPAPVAPQTGDEAPPSARWRMRQWHRECSATQPWREVCGHDSLVRGEQRQDSKHGA